MIAVCCSYCGESSFSHNQATANLTLCESDFCGSCYQSKNKKQNFWFDKVECLIKFVQERSSELIIKEYPYERIKDEINEEIP